MKNTLRIVSLIFVLLYGESLLADLPTVEEESIEKVVAKGPILMLCEAYCVEYVLHPETGLQFIVNKDYDKPVQFLLDGTPKVCPRTQQGKVCVELSNSKESCDYTRSVWLKNKPTTLFHGIPILSNNDDMEANHENSCEKASIAEVPLSLLNAN